MTERRPLLLVELLVMLLVFSLAAALCLRGFAWAQDRSVQLQQQAQAAVQAQNAAELLKHTRGAYDRLGAVRSADQWCLSYDENWQVCETGATFVLRITPEDCGIQGLAGARLEVCREDGLCLTALTVRWQEVAE